jgi:hypothetical protein
MSVGYEQDRDTRVEDQQALEEIRSLFARYRRIARHGMVTEHDEPAEPPEGRSGSSPSRARASADRRSTLEPSK